LAAKRVELILLSRFIAGLSVGGEYTAIMSAISEFIPTPYRGRTSVFVDGSWHLGSIFAALVSIIFNNIFVWKVMFGMGLFAVIPLFILRKHIP
jgi:MFS family permease